MARRKLTEDKLSSKRNPHNHATSDVSLRLGSNGKKYCVNTSAPHGLVVDTNNENGVLTVDFILENRESLKLRLEADNSKNINDDWWNHVFLFAAYAGCIDVVSLLVERGVSVDFSDVKGQTALHLASSAGHYKIVKLLLECSSSPYLLDANGQTPLCLASENGHQRVITLLEKACDVIPEVEILSESSDTGLFNKICKVIEKAMRLRINREIREKDHAREPATEPQEGKRWKRDEKKMSDRDGVKIRLRKRKTKSRRAVGFNLEYITNDVYESVAKSVSHGEKTGSKTTDSIQTISGCHITEELKRHLTFFSRNGETCLHVASKLGFAEQLPGLAREGDINCRDWNRETALHKAAKNGREQCVETLLQLGVSVKATSTKYGRSALHLAAVNGHTKCIKHLLKRGADVNFPDELGQTALHASARRGDRECVTFLVRHGVDISCRDNRGNTALHLAVIYGNEEFLLALLDEGADVESLDARGQTPLHVSAYRGQVSCISLLLDRGANLGSQDKNGNSALHVAALKNQDEALLVLIRRGADVNSQNNRRTTPLHISASEGHVPCTTALIQAGARLEILDEHGMNALHITSLLGHLVCILLLVEGGANVNTCDRKGLTALHHSCKSGFEECVSILLENGADRP